MFNTYPSQKTGLNYMVFLVPRATHRGTHLHSYAIAVEVSDSGEARGTIVILRVTSFYYYFYSSSGQNSIRYSSYRFERTQASYIPKRASRSGIVCFYTDFRNTIFSRRKSRKTAKKIPFKVNGRRSKKLKLSDVFTRRLLWHTLT